MRLTEEREQEIREWYSRDKHLPLSVHQPILELLAEIDALRAENKDILRANEVLRMRLESIGTAFPTVEHRQHIATQIEESKADLLWSQYKRLQVINDALRAEIDVLRNKKT